ncbi:MAG: ArnT family glycosyltransferase, partial [Candidatus Hodarchaeota archaeon]
TPSPRFLCYIKKLWAVLVQFRFVVVIGLLAFWVKVAFIHSTDMWDEGWFTSIASRMADGLSDPFMPMYYTGNNNDILFFDKPPVAFWGGALLMIIFGRTTFAAKGIVILGGAGLALIVYFLYSHQLENKSAAIVAGLLVALAHFLTFYSRTAYIDSFVVFMAALVMLLGIRAIDAIFIENNLLKGYFLLFVTIVVNILNILTKAWQGVLTFPAIVVYLLFRYLERHVNLDDLRAICQEISERFTVSRKDMEPYLLVKSEYIKSGIPFPFIVAIVAGGSSFFGAFPTKQLFASSIILALVAAIGCYIVFLRSNVEQKSQLRSEGLITGVVAGYIAGYIGALVISIFYGRLEGPFIIFADALGDEDIFSIDILIQLIPIEFISDPLSEFFSNEILALFILEVIASIFGLILTFGTAFFLSGILLDLFNRKSKFLRVIYEGIDLIPLVILGGWIGIWFITLLLMGREGEDALSITLFGVAVTLLLIPIVTAYPKIKNFVTEHFKLDTRIRSAKELSNFSNHLLFLAIAIIFIIISFYPFVAWIQYLDSNIANGTFPWVVRTPGELYSDPERPNPVTYTFLFFEYYIGWRFTHATKSGDLPKSVGSAINDLALWVVIPFFIIGIVAFFFSSKRNPALGSALLAWLVTIPLVFFPAQFQLNYYYIPLAIPYLAIAAKGFEFIYSNDQWRMTVVDNVERLLAGFIFYFTFAFEYLITPVSNLVKTPFAFLSGTELSVLIDQVVNLDLGFLLFISVIYLIPFTIVAFRYLKTFPGIIAVGFAYDFFIESWFKSNGLKILYNTIFHNLFETIVSMDLSWVLDVVEHGAPVATILGLILLIFGLYWLKPKVKPQAFIFLGLILSAMLINVSVLIHINQIFDLRFQESAIYIKNHGGGYNYSTWVIPDAGSQFAMRYYLGYEIEDSNYHNRYYNIPFSDNSSLKMELYYQQHKNIKFWVILNNSEHHDVPPYAIAYPEAYKWFTTNEHLVCVDDVVGLTSWYTMHLFVNHTWISEQGYNWTKLYG